MSSYLYRVGVFVVRMRWWVIAGWLVLAVASGLLAQALGGSLQATFSIPGTPAQTALDTAQQRFPQIAGTSIRIRHEHARWRAGHRGDWAGCGVRLRGARGRPRRHRGLLPGRRPGHRSASGRRGPTRSDRAGRRRRLRVAEFGLGGPVGLVVGALTPVSSTAPLLATMLGLAVGIDYALLIVSRHRTQVASGWRCASPSRAVATAGTAVLFAGMTVVIVVIALLGLGVAGIPFLSVMGLEAVAAVIVALAVAITLLPALLTVPGRALAPRRPPRHREQVVPRWARLATRSPTAALLVVGIALLVTAVPAWGCV